MKWNRTYVKRRTGALAFAVILALGWRYPYLAYCLFLNVAVGLIGALRHGGRHGCGTFCPRGAFYSLLPDTGRKVPAGLLTRRAPILVMALMFSGLVFWLRPTTVRAWGVLFYIMIVITTAVGLVGWLVFNRYFWCSVCPMGKIYKTIRPGRTGIRVAESCVKCGLCAKACPFGFFPPAAAQNGVFADPDCMHCRRCVECCPKHALSLEKR
jgi:NAD-dependent dihydropyrimidine dehydrogenase PreA subunit